ncbi:MAG: precorrin-8X methylmutase [Cyanobacteriota bacterium]|nr:precorrin-8X methylmutase [Cyanobacteriota bacterium]
MEWHRSDAQSLRFIDHQMAGHGFSPAEYEIIRRVIYATGDFDYGTCLYFSPQALAAGAAALAARTTIVVDVPMVQVGVTPALQGRFANPVYCSMEALTRPQRGKSQTAWGMETLAQRYPEAIFVVGTAEVALAALVDLIERGEIQPALVVGTPAVFLDGVGLKGRLGQTPVAQVAVNGSKGGATVATAIMEGLIDLAWQAYESPLV